MVQTSARHRVPLSDAAEGDGFFLRPNGGNLLVAGISGGGKSTMVTGVLERLAESGFQFCVIDPEGDYSELEGAVVLGDARQQPRVPELLEILRRPDSNAVVNMLDVDLADRPTFFDGLLTRLSELRAQTGRPHWIVVDEAHHLVPASRHAAGTTLPRELHATILVTVHPDQLAPEVLATVETVAAVGDAPASTIRQLLCGPRRRAAARCQATIGSRPAKLCCGSAAPIARRLGFGSFSRSCSAGATPANTPRVNSARTAVSTSAAPMAPCPCALRTSPCSCRSRPASTTRTWLHHLRAGHYSAWIRDAIKDEDLADEFAAVERDRELSADDSRARIKEAVDRRYTGPASEAPRLGLKQRTERG